MFRVDPALPLASMKTYRIVQPVHTHFRSASCAEVECEAFQSGWVTEIDTATELGVRQANYIYAQSGRKFTYSQNESVLSFTFPAGQKCFTEHNVPLERDPLFIIRDGDWRGNPTGRSRRIPTAEQWVDDFSENQEALKDRIDKES